VKIFFIILFFFPFSLFAQETVELKNADKLTGKVVDGKSVREAEGNVQFVQGNIRVFCNSATQFIDENRIILVGNVRIYQDTLTLTTSRGVYYGNEKRATGEGGVTLKDPNAILRADYGTYYFNEAKAIFNGDVIIRNPQYQITSKELTYYRNSEDSYAKGNVKVETDSAIITAENVDFLKRKGLSFAYQNAKLVSDSTVITADTLRDFSFENRSEASGNVTIVSENNNTVITGNFLENFEETNYTKITGNAKLQQIEQNANGISDTLFIYSNVMEAFRDKPEKYTASGNVETIRNEFMSRSENAFYFRDAETVSLTGNPVVWQSTSQMTGDSIYAELPGKQLQTIYVMKFENSENPSFLISQSDSIYFKERYNQVTGDNIIINFMNDKVNDVFSDNNSSSIYFLYEEDGKANGVNKISGVDMKVLFDSTEQVEKIIIEQDPTGQYASENNISEINLRLPGFIWRDDKPIRK
jgi:lipopolysaccharide export system protein LptA